VAESATKVPVGELWREAGNAVKKDKPRESTDRRLTRVPREPRVTLEVRSGERDQARTWRLAIRVAFVSMTLLVTTILVLHGLSVSASIESVAGVAFLAAQILRNLE
jgi:hypothetical protein